MADTDPILREIPKMLRGKSVIARLLRDDDTRARFEAIDESLGRLAPWMPCAKNHLSVADSLMYIRRSQADWRLRLDAALRPDRQFTKF